MNIVYIIFMLKESNKSNRVNKNITAKLQFVHLS